MEMPACDYEQSTFDVLCKADAMLVQRRNIGVETLWIWRHDFNVVKTLPLQHPWYIVRWTYYPTLWQRLTYIVSLSPSYQVVKALWIWCPDFNVAANLEQLCVIFTLYHQRRCNVVYWLYEVTMLQHYHNIAIFFFCFTRAFRRALTKTIVLFLLYH